MNTKTKKRKPTTDAIEILHRRYFAGKPERMAMLKRMAEALNKRVEIRFVALRHPKARGASHKQSLSR